MEVLIFTGASVDGDVLGGLFCFFFWHLKYNSVPVVNADDGILMPVHCKSDRNCHSK